MDAKQYRDEGVNMLDVSIHAPVMDAKFLVSLNGIALMFQSTRP